MAMTGASCAFQLLTINPVSRSQYFNNKLLCALTKPLLSGLTQKQLTVSAFFNIK